MVSLQTIEGISSEIAFILQEIEYKSLVKYLDLATLLQLLMEKYERKGLTKKAAYVNIQKSTGIAQSTFENYQSFIKFIKEYPRFLHTGLMYKGIRINKSKISKWFQDEEQTRLDENNYISWKFN